jgi:hypothetical protein
MTRQIENHVESCYCWECGGWGKVEYEEPKPDPMLGGELVGKIGHCHKCDGTGELHRAKLTQTTVIRAFLTQAKNALEDIEMNSSDLDTIYSKIDALVGDVENYERKVGTRDG